MKIYLLTSNQQLSFVKALPYLLNFKKESIISKRSSASSKSGMLKKIKITFLAFILPV